jgi:Protein of unknown function (DUF4232)
LGGATMSDLGSVTLTNKGGVACSLPTTVPRVTIIMRGRPLEVRQDPWSQSSAARSLPAQPVRVLKPGKKAEIWLQWRNWCSRPSAAESVRLVIALRFTNGLHLRAPTTGPSPSPPACVTTGPSWLNASRPYAPNA